MSEWQTVTISGKDWPDARFTGRLLADFDSRAGRAQDMWQRLELWELASGNQVATSIGCSTNPRHRELGSWELIPVAPAVEMRKAALRCWRWTMTAKRFAARMGWDIVQELE